MVSGEREFQTNGTTSAKALRQKHICLASLRIAMGEGRIIRFEIGEGTRNKMI